MFYLRITLLTEKKPIYPRPRPHGAHKPRKTPKPVVSKGKVYSKNERDGLNEEPLSVN